jgi:hypothetical protein
LERPRMLNAATEIAKVFMICSSFQSCDSQNLELSFARRIQPSPP